MNTDILAIVVSLFVLVVAPLWAIDRRTKRLERMLSAVQSRLGIDGSLIPEPSDEVRALAADPNKKVAAIKAYREQTGLGLREAKEVVERLSPHP